MHDIVIATTPGAAKREFANALFRASGGRVSLVILQKERPKPILKRVLSAVRRVKPSDLLVEIWHALRFRGADREALDVFKARTSMMTEDSVYLPPVLETYSINDDVVRTAMERLKPKVLVIWGGSIIKPHILALAEAATNMHGGLCPDYKGANGNQHAVLENKRGRIAVTIHQAVPDVDAGGIYEILHADPKLKPPEIFRDLNDRATQAYLKLALKLLESSTVLTTAQPQGGRTYKNMEFTFKKRRRLASMMRAWMRE